jgi:hypothetical protein
MSIVLSGESVMVQQVKYISLENANGLSLQAAARTLGVKVLGRKYADAIASTRITMEQLELLREGLKLAKVRSIPSITQKRPKGDYPHIALVFAEE